MNCLRHQNYKNKNSETKQFWCDWLINYAPKLIKTMGVVKDETLSLFNTSITKNYCKPTRFNDVHGGREKLTK